MRDFEEVLQLLNKDSETTVRNTKCGAKANMMKAFRILSSRIILTPEQRAKIEAAAKDETAALNENALIEYLLQMCPDRDLIGYKVNMKVATRMLATTPNLTEEAKAALYAATEDERAANILPQTMEKLGLSSQMKKVLTDIPRIVGKQIKAHNPRPLPIASSNIENELNKHVVDYFPDDFVAKVIGDKKGGLAAARLAQSGMWSQVKVRFYTAVGRLANRMEQMAFKRIAVIIGPSGCAELFKETFQTKAKSGKSESDGFAGEANPQPT